MVEQVSAGVGVLGGEVGRGVFEVVVGVDQTAGFDASAQAPTVEVVLVGAGLGAVVVGYRGVAGKFGMGREVIGQHQGLAVGAMFKPEVDAFMFQLAADEGKVGFSVLDEIGPGLVGGLQPHVKAHRVFAEDLVKDVGHAAVLPDTEAGTARGVPQTGGNGGLINPVPAVLADGCEVDHLAAEVAPAASVGFQFHRATLADLRLAVDISLGGLEAHLETVERG
nr:hypothetical protein [Parazoarcus communis]